MPRRGTLARQEARAGYALLSPTLIVVLVMVVLPILWTVVIAFQLGVSTALVVVILYQAWRYFPFSFLCILARLQALPAELDEAARVDGATVYLLTQGGAGTEVVSLRVFRYLTGRGDIGAAALSLVLALLLVVLLFVFFTRIGLRGELFGLVLVYASQIVPVTIHFALLFLVENRENWTVSLGLSQLAG